MMKDSNQIKLNELSESVNQPKGIDYNQLLNKLSYNSIFTNPTFPSPTEKEIQIQDFRVNLKKNLDKIQHENSDGVSKNSIIPEPHMLIPFENSESDWKPPTSDWIAPHGPQWGPMTR